MDGHIIAILVAKGFKDNIMDGHIIAILVAKGFKENIMDGHIIAFWLQKGPGKILWMATFRPF